MNEQQFLEKLESRHGEIGCHDCLHALLARYSDTNVGHLYHGYVVRTIADGQSGQVQLLLDNFHQVCFLQWRRTAAQHTCTMLAKRQEWSS